MRRTKIKNAEELKRLTLSEAKKAFLQHCKIKNLSEKTINTNFKQKWLPALSKTLIEKKVLDGVSKYKIASNNKELYSKV